MKHWAKPYGWFAIFLLTILIGFANLDSTAHADGPYGCNVKIMPLGDSLTNGYGGPLADGTGFRKPLWLQLAAWGDIVDFVGSQIAGDPEIFDSDHEGHNGYDAYSPGIPNILESVYAWLENQDGASSDEPVDIVLLHIGTNDISHGQSATTLVLEIEDILDEIDRYESDYSTEITVILARIINRLDPASNRGQETTAYNGLLQTMADNRIAAGDQIIVVDMESALLYPDDMYDVVHPNEGGYAKMADVWFEALDTFLPGGCDAGPDFISLGLKQSVNKIDWQDVNGSLAAGFSMNLIPAVTYHYLDVSNDPGATTTSGPLAQGSYGFYLDSYPPGYLAYWDSRGVNASAGAGTWQEHMYLIITGVEPIFYLKVDSGPTYMLVDGLQRDYAPIGIEDYLRVSGDYPLGDYQFSGAVFDDFGGGSVVTVDMTFQEPADTDNDNIPDYIEDGSGTCLSSTDDDSDEDGILDGNEDLNGNGNVDPGEMDPCDPDSDNDGLPDGIEIGLAAAQGNDTGPGFVPDADPATTTDPLNNDTDNDGLLDGQEDTNQNGKVDPGEYNPGLNETCPADMIAYWKLDETSGADFDDFINGHDGSCPTNCPAPGSGQIDGGQVFDTSTGIDIPADSAFNWGAADSFSIEFWMKGIPGQTCAGTGEENNEVMVGRDDAGSNLHWWLGCVNTTGNARFQLADTSGDSVAIDGPSISDGNWHHLVGVRDGSNNLNRFYVDGVEVISPVSKTYSSGFESATATLNLGWLNLAGGYHFEGTLDEVALYNRVLTSTEISQHYDNGMAGLGNCDVGPQFTSFNLETSVDRTADKADWDDVNGSLAAGFSMNLIPAVTYHYLDVSNDPGATTTNRPLAQGSYGFYLATHPPGYLAYWDSRGVNASAGAGTWQEHMYLIITGVEPIFYLKVDSGPTYMLVDGLQRDYAPIGIEDYLRVNGGYPLGDYTFTGTVFDDFGNGSDISVGMAFEQGPVPDIDGDGDVDGYDLYQFILTFGLSSGDAGFDARSDFNMDDAVNAADLSIFASEYGNAP